MTTEFVLTEVHGVAVLGVIGDLDLASAPPVRRELLLRVQECGDRPLVVVDLLGVDHLDAIGLGVLFAGVVATRARGGDLALSRAEPQVAAVLSLTRVDEILPVHPSIAAAVDALLGRVPASESEPSGRVPESTDRP